MNQNMQQASKIDMNAEEVANNNLQTEYSPKNDIIVLLAVLFVCMAAFMTLLQSFFPVFDKEQAFYETSGIAWFILRTIALLLCVLIPYIITYQKWAFFSVLLLNVLAAVVVLLAVNGGFQIRPAQWALIFFYLAIDFLLLSKHKEYQYVVYYRFSIESIMGAVGFLLYQWFNAAISLYIIYMQRGDDVSFSKCLWRVLALLFPNGQMVTHSGFSNVPMIPGQFTQFLTWFWGLSLLVTILLTIYTWLVCKPGEPEFLQLLGYGVSVFVHRLKGEKITSEVAAVSDAAFEDENEDTSKEEEEWNQEARIDLQKEENMLRSEAVLSILQNIEESITSVQKQYLDGYYSEENETENTNIAEKEMIEDEQSIEAIDNIVEEQTIEIEEKAVEEDTVETEEETVAEDIVETEEETVVGDTVETEEEAVEETAETEEETVAEDTVETEEDAIEEETTETEEEAVEEIVETEEEAVEEETTETEEEAVEETAETEEEIVAVEEDTVETEEETVEEDIVEIEEEAVEEETTENEEEAVEEDTAELEEEAVEETTETEEEVVEEDTVETEEEVVEEIVETEEETVAEDTVETEEEAVEETAETEEEAVEEDTAELEEVAVEETVSVEEAKIEEEELDIEEYDVNDEEDSDDYVSLKDIIKQKPAKPRDLQECVRDFGTNFAAYRALEFRGKMFTSDHVEGFLPYRIIGKEAIVSGSPLCADQDLSVMLSEYEEFCLEKQISTVFINVSATQAKLMEQCGYTLLHCGAEPRFYLNKEVGSQAALKKRSKMIKQKYGVEIFEYRYYENTDPDLEMQMTVLNDDWLDDRNSEDFTIYKRRQRDAFLPQTLNFDKSSGRRYYYALDANKQMQGFIVFCPVASVNGYSCEAGRKHPNAIRKLMELIMHEAFASLKEEGASWAGMGLFPDEKRLDNCSARENRWLNFVCRYYEDIYTCRNYEQAYAKYKPQKWEDVYIVTKEYQEIKKEK